MSQFYQLKLIDKCGNVVHQEVVDEDVSDAGVIAFQGKHYTFGRLQHNGERTLFFHEVKLHKMPVAKQLPEVSQPEFQRALMSMLAPTASWKPALPLDDGETMPIDAAHMAPASDGIFVTLKNGERFVLHTSKLVRKDG